MREYGPCWPLEKVKYRTVEDFGCADWEWLLRWHDSDGIGVSVNFSLAVRSMLMGFVEQSRCGRVCGRHIGESSHSEFADSYG